MDFSAPPIGSPLGSSAPESSSPSPSVRRRRTAQTRLKEQALRLLQANPYHKTALATLATANSPVSLYRDFCEEARKSNFISKTGRENFSANLSQEQVNSLFNKLKLIKETEEGLPDLLKVHVRLLLVWFGTSFSDQLAVDRTYANKMLAESKRFAESYRLSPQLALQLNSLGLYTPTHRFTLQKNDFWHLSPVIPQRNPQIVIFGPGDLFLRLVLPQIFALTESKNLEGKAYLGDKTKIVVVGESSEAELIPFGSDSRTEGMIFKRYVLESCKNKGIAVPRDLDKIFKYITYKSLPSGDRERQAFIDSLKAGANLSEPNLFFMSVPPKAYPSIWGLIEPAVGEKDIVYFEKPFGANRQETIRLNEMLRHSSKRQNVHVMDHYLGKEALALLLDCRRQFLDRYLNADHVESVQIVCSEVLNVKGRKFYDGIGAIRDMLQSHMLGFFSLVAMDLPEADLRKGGKTTAGKFSKAKLKFLKTVPKFKIVDLTLGQYRDYLADLEIEKSNTPTFFAVKLRLESERWRGVDFDFMHGKELEDKYSQVVINFKASSDPECPRKAILVVYPDPRMLVWFNDTPENKPEVIKLEEMDVFSSRKDLHPEAYSRLFLQALHGNPISNMPTEVAQQWRIIKNIIAPGLTPLVYERRSKGPISDSRFAPKADKQWNSPTEQSSYGWQD